MSRERSERVALAALEGAADEKLAEADIRPPPSQAAGSSSKPESAPAPPVPSGVPESRLPHQNDAPQPIPVADVPSRLATTIPRAKPRGRRIWTAADIAVVSVAIAVIGASLACLVWVLR